MTHPFRAIAGALFISLACSPGLAAQDAGTVDYRLNFRHGAVDPLGGLRVLPGFEAPINGRSFLVQLHDEIDDRARNDLARLGAEIKWYAPQRAYIVRMDPAQAPAVQALASVRWVGPYHTFFRLEPGLVEAIIRDELGPQRYVISLMDKRVDAAALENAVEDAGGRVDIRSDGGLIVEATLTERQLMAVAGRDEVLAIQRYEAPEEDMDNCLIQAGVNYVKAAAGIDGKGMRGHIMEGIYPNHTEFAALPPYRTTPVAVFDGAGTTHGNATAGQVFARGASPQATGILPFGQCYYTNYNYVYNNSNRYGLTRTLVDPAGNYRVMMQTASWGYPRTRVYDARSAEMDDIIFDFDLFVTQSQSNAGNQDSRPQAWSKDIASVGGFYHFNNSNPADDRWNGGGSTGPANDGRIGVTYTGYYDAIYTTYSSTGYGTFGGTSGATPICNGLGGVAIQMFTDGLFGYGAAPTWMDRFDYLPHYTTTKMLLATTTEQLAFASANRYQQGWGFPNVQNLYDERNRLLVIDELDVLTQGGSRTYYVFGRGGAEFRAGMTHSDPPTASPFLSPHRINSLHMKVTNPNNTVYWGNNGLISGLASTPGGVANDLDTEELVIIPNAPRGVYAVEVSAPAVRIDSHVETRVVDADYALVVRGLGGLRDRSGPVLDVLSSAPGDFRVSLTNLPASYSIGYVLWSINASRPVSTGNLFGVEADFLTLAILGFAPQIGSPFAFQQTANPGVFPNATYAFPAFIANAVSGITFDAVACFYDAGANMVAASNVDRQQVQ